VFNDDELDAFFNECDGYRYAIFKTYLMAGLRKAELENLTWDDVDFMAGIIRVRPKKDWQPKTWEARDIEVPDELLKILKERARPGKLVFANSNGNKYTHSWDDCVEIAEKSSALPGRLTADCRSGRSGQYIPSGLFHRFWIGNKSAALACNIAGSGDLTRRIYAPGGCTDRAWTIESCKS
jgi:hypothetical protein